MGRGNTYFTNWMDNMEGYPIPILRKIARVANHYGLFKTARFILQHIALRKEKA
jgi:hypothetical protein